MQKVGSSQFTMMHTEQVLYRVSTVHSVVCREYIVVYNNQCSVCTEAVQCRGCVSGLHKTTSIVYSVYYTLYQAPRNVRIATCQHVALPVYGETSLSEKLRFLVPASLGEC